MIPGTMGTAGRDNVRPGDDKTSSISHEFVPGTSARQVRRPGDHECKEQQQHQHEPAHSSTAEKELAAWNALCESFRDINSGTKGLVQEGEVQGQRTGAGGVQEGFRDKELVQEEEDINSGMPAPRVVRPTHDAPGGHSALPGQPGRHCSPPDLHENEQSSRREISHSRDMRTARFSEEDNFTQGVEQGDEEQHDQEPEDDQQSKNSNYRMRTNMRCRGHGRGRCGLPPGGRTPPPGPSPTTSSDRDRDRADSESDPPTERLVATMVEILTQAEEISLSNLMGYRCFRQLKQELAKDMPKVVLGGSRAVRVVIYVEKIRGAIFVTRSKDADEELVFGNDIINTTNPFRENKIMKIRSTG